jgi:DNA-binding MarR family transcriptional regulator
MSVASLAGRRGVTHQTMRLVVAQLEANGLVRQETNPIDRRSRIATLTPAGNDALEREREARTANIEEAIRRLLSPQEQGVLRAALPLLDRLSQLPDWQTKIG